MPRRGVSDEDILTAIEAITARDVEPQTRLIRAELGNTGDYSRIQSVLDRWRNERTEQRSIAVPEMPEAVSRALGNIWLTAYKSADELLEAKRTAFETERFQYEQGRAEMLEEISGLENTRNTLEADAETANIELQRLRLELEQTHRDLAASTARAQTLEQQLDTIRTEQQTTLTTIQEWMERATTAEAQLAATSQTTTTPKKPAARKRSQPSNDG